MNQLRKRKFKFRVSGFGKVLKKCPDLTCYQNMKGPGKMSVRIPDLNMEQP